MQRKLYGINSSEFENTLTEKHLEWLRSEKLTYEQAEEILNAKNYKGGIAMRGRQSFNPIEKMGLVYLNAEKKIIVTSFGNSLLAEDYDLGNIFFRSFIKWQYPNPDLNQYPLTEGYDVKPLIATFHLIKKVNNICAKSGIKAKGVSRTEFALFFTTLSNYKNIDSVSKKLIEFRKVYDNKKNMEKCQRIHR